MAKSLLAKAGLSAGITSLPRCNDPRLALAVVRNSKMLVHAMSADHKTLDRLTQAADAEGLLSQSLYVEQGSASALPYADNLVELLLITDFSEADLTRLSAKEILRVLTPGHGIAIVGEATSGSRSVRLSKKVLASWTKELAPGSVAIWEDATGLWTSIRKTPLVGADSWSHRFHGPENNPVSLDTTLKAPFMTQWLGRPLWSGWFGSNYVGAGGRIFEIRNVMGEMDCREHYLSLTLVARSAYNGTILWTRPFTGSVHGERDVLFMDNKWLKKDSGTDPNYYPGRCCMVATPEKLYLIDGDGVLSLDAETGAQCGRLAGPQPGGQIKWIAISDGILAMLAGDKDHWWAQFWGDHVMNAVGHRLSAYDLTTGKELWRHKEPRPAQGWQQEKLISTNYPAQRDPGIQSDHSCRIALYKGYLYAYSAPTRVFSRSQDRQRTLEQQRSRIAGPCRATKRI